MRNDPAEIAQVEFFINRFQVARDITQELIQAYFDKILPGDQFPVAEISLHQFLIQPNHLLTGKIRQGHPAAEPRGTQTG